MEQIIVGFIFLVFGGLNAVRPDILMRFQIWSQRVIIGMKCEPSRRTYIIMRIFGVVFIILGLLVITGSLAGYLNKKVTSFEECEKAGWFVRRITVYDGDGAIEKECELWSGEVFIK